MEKTIDYKAIDRKAILDYLTSVPDGEVEVSKVMAESGADKFRVYPLLFELQLEGIIAVTQESDMGTPRRVALRK